jgi:hypothetical protein
MKFIKQYFSTKIKAITRLCVLMGEAWEDKMYIVSILTLLWTIFCTTFGLLLIPLDLLLTAILNRVKPDWVAEVMQEFCDELSCDDFSEAEL